MFRFRNEKNSYELRMTDIHCHVLPGVDDGSEDMDESLEMLRIAEKSGIDRMILTPHYKASHHNASPETLRKRMEELQSEAAEEGIEVELALGNEVMYFSELGERYDEGKILTLNGTDRLLVEFHPTADYMYVRNAIDDVIGMGFTPILAHVERVECMVADPERVYELRSMGCEIQMNAADYMGVMGRNVRKFLQELLDEEAIDYLGTDAHDCRKRIPDVRKCLSDLYDRYDDEYVMQIAYKNADTIFEHKRVRGSETDEQSE